MSLGPHRPATGYERRDLPLGVTAFAGIVVAALTALVLGISWWLQASLSTHLPDRVAAAHSAGEQGGEAAAMPAEPTQEWRIFRTDEDRRLGTYGWVSRERGVVHVPIERAMDLSLAEHLFQNAPDSQPAAAESQPTPGASGPEGQP